MKDDVTHILNDLTSGEDLLAEKAARNLAGLPEASIPTVFAALQALLIDPDPDHRWWAVRALSAIPGNHTSNLLIKALQDEEVTVRQCAALGLRMHPDPLAVPALIQALEEEDYLVSKLAADALIAIGEPATPALIEVMEVGSHRVRLEAVRALALTGDERSIPALFSALDEDSAIMEHWATQGLEQMGVGMAFFQP